MLRVVASPLPEMLHLKALTANDVVPKAFGIALFSTSVSFLLFGLSTLATHHLNFFNLPYASDNSEAKHELAVLRCQDGARHPFCFSAANIGFASCWGSHRDRSSYS
jgi:hypothetical protein